MMKKVEAIIRKTKFDDVQDALRAAGIDFITFWDVRGVGKSTQARVYRGIKYDTSSIERTMVVFYCREKYLKPALAALQAAAKTGQVGDGKIFISEISDGIRIRTGESGEKSVYIEGEA